MNESPQLSYSLQVPLLTAASDSPELQGPGPLGGARTVGTTSHLALCARAPAALISSIARASTRVLPSRMLLDGMAAICGAVWVGDVEWVRELRRQRCCSPLALSVGGAGELGPQAACMPLVPTIY